MVAALAHFVWKKKCNARYISHFNVVSIVCITNECFMCGFEYISCVSLFFPQLFASSFSPFSILYLPLSLTVCTYLCSFFSFFPVSFFCSYFDLTITSVFFCLLLSFLIEFILSLSLSLAPSIFTLYDLCYMWLYNDILLKHSMCMKRE